MRRRTATSPPRGPSAEEIEEEDSWYSWLGLDGDGAWWQLGVVLPLAAVVVVVALFANRPAHCTVQEGLCTTTTCSCADPAHQLRELRTPEGQECWQCVAMCPAQADGNVTDACYAGSCECADPTQERIRADASTPDAPCYKCVTPPPVVVLRAGPEPSRSCLVRVPRSKLPPPPPRPGAIGNSSNATMGSAPVSIAEPVLRLVLTEDRPDLNASCASFVREGANLRERNTSLCLSWSSSGGVWGLGKCAGPGAPEAQLQSFRETAAGEVGGEGDVNTAAFCTSDIAPPPTDSLVAAGDVVGACVGLRGHICTAEASVCTPRPCECEDPTWIKHESPLLNDAGPCWSCSPPLVPYCSTQQGVCTTMQCECEDPSHEKIRSNTTEPPVRACWSCRPQFDPNSGARVTGGGAVGALVAVFLCGLLGGLALRRWGEEPLPALAAQKGRRGQKAAMAALRPLPWSERLALEMEELWATLEDGAALLGQAWAVVTKPLRRWRKSAAGAAAPYLKSFNETASGAAARVTDAASDASDKLAGIVNSARSLVPASNVSHTSNGNAGTAAGQNKPRKVQPQPQGKEAPVEAPAPPPAPAPVEAPAPTAAAAAPGTAEGTKVEEAVRKRRRPKKKGNSEAQAAAEDSTPLAAEVEAEDNAAEEAQDVSTPSAPATADTGLSAEECTMEREAATAAPTDPPAGEEEMQELANLPNSESAAALEPWDPLSAAAESSRSGDFQHARLLMLLSNTRNCGVKVDKRSLAANWLLVYHVTPATHGQEAAGGEQEADESAIRDIAEVDEEADESAIRDIAEVDEEASGGWDPLSSPPQMASGDRGTSLQHARLLLLLAGARHSGTPYCTRTLAATWLMFFYMPESCRKLPKLQPEDVTQVSEDEDQCPAPEAAAPAAAAEGKRRRGGRAAGGKTGSGTAAEGGRQQRHRRQNRH